MVLPGQAAQPVNGQSTALGLSIRKVIVEQVVPERGVAIVRDEMQYTTEVPYRVQQGRGRIPRVGDFWYVDRSMGPWTFASYIAKDDADITTFDGPMTVAGDLAVEGGVHVGEGVFVVEGASVGTGLFVGEGAHVVGQLHSVTGISTDGGIIATGSITANNGITMPQGKYIIRGPVAAPALQNGWVNFGSTFQTVRYIEYPDGTAGIIGVIKDGTTTSGTTLFNVPAHVRPDGDHNFLCTGSGSTKTQIVVRSDGNVVIQNPDAGLTWLSFGNCRWPVASAY